MGKYLQFETTYLTHKKLECVILENSENHMFDSEQGQMCNMVGFTMSISIILFALIHSVAQIIKLFDPIN